MLVNVAEKALRTATAAACCRTAWRCGTARSTAPWPTQGTGHLGEYPAGMVNRLHYAPVFTAIPPKRAAVQ